MQQENLEPFSDDPSENIRIENEILKLKMKAQFGDQMMMGSSTELPPEVENQFLKNIIQFEEACINMKHIKLYELIGSPPYKPASELKDDEIGDELIYLLKLMYDKHIVLDILGDYDHRTIYTFVTEELFEHETETNDGLPEGMVRHFIYEEFHPNHIYDIENRIKEFVNEWFEKKFNEYSWQLADTFVLDSGETRTKAQVLERLYVVLDSYPVFGDHTFEISNVSFRLDEEEETGMGHGDGYVKYTVILEKGEQLLLEGGFRFYVAYEYGWWKIVFFHFPGFEW